MNEENSKKIWAYIQAAGDKLVGKLMPSRNHPGFICTRGYLCEE
jgi:hypothetical protein